MAYRARVVGSDSAANSDVHLDTYIETDKGGSWELVPYGHTTIVLHYQEVVAITDDPVMSDPEKRAALIALFTQKVIDRGIVDSDYAEQSIIDLLPGGDWPIDFPINIS